MEGIGYNNGQPLGEKRKGEKKMIRLEVLFLTQLVVGVIMIIMLQKINSTKKQVDDIMNQVKEYLSFITQDVEEEEKKERFSEKIKTKKNSEESQNRLIEAVLGDFFQ